MSMTDDVLGWSAAAAIVGGIVYAWIKSDNISKPTKNLPNPYDDPELKSAREDANKSLKTLGIEPPPTPKF